MASQPFPDSADRQLIRASGAPDVGVTVTFFLDQALTLPATIFADNGGVPGDSVASFVSDSWGMLPGRFWGPTTGETVLWTSANGGPATRVRADLIDAVTDLIDSDPVSDAELTSALALKAPLAGPTFTGTVGGITKAMVGLSNVDNTTDASKPVSTAQATSIGERQFGQGVYVATDPQYGYVSGTNLSPAIATIIAAIPTDAGNGTPYGGTILVPPGNWTLDTAITLKSGVRIVGAGRGSTRLVYANADAAGHMFTWSGTLSNFVIEHIHLRSTAGHIFRGTTSLYTVSVRDCHIYVSDPASSIVDHQSAGNYDKVVFDRCYLMRGGAASVPAFNILNSGGAANENVWRDCWFFSGGPGTVAATVPFLRMHNTSASNFANDNAFVNITGQQNIAGLLDLQSHANLTVTNVVDWDINTLTGAPTVYTGSLIKVGKSTLGPASRGVTVTNCGVRGNTHGASTYDVEFVSGEVTDSLIVNPYKTSSGTKVLVSATATHNISIVNANADSVWTGQPAGVRHRFPMMPQFLSGAWVGPDTGGTAATDGLRFGPDVNLYRGAGNVLQTDDSFRSASTIRATLAGGEVTDIGAVGPTSQGGMRIGGAGATYVIRGTGTPEGAVSAGVGSLFLRTDGGAGTTLYVKESGTGNTGWVGK